MNYFITAITDNPEYAPINHRCFGYYSNKVTALNAVGVNTGEMHECLYNYLVVEGVGEGIHPEVQEEIWFKWTGGYWEKCDVPEHLNHICNWAVG